jgi:pantoate--beta-alanine ligase
LREARADLVWAPAVGDMYADDFAVQVVPAGPAAVGLEDAARPHFFAGVATVVAKLLIQCLPDIAVFGEKDYQQLRVVTSIARDLDLPVKILGAATVREADGLAMASRNIYLTPDERAVAPVLYRVLKLCAEKIAAGRPIAAILAEGRETLERAGLRLDYLEARDVETLRRPTTGRPLRLLAAATLGQTRLIDNVAVP